jgi:Zn-dependent peptidase ImmA (M78 family)/transcriptional regulator with XRE-family HTH domain
MNIQIQPKLLQWARERVGLDEAALAKKLGTKTDRVIEWEQNGELSWKKAEKLANVTHIPFGYLFLTEPPVENLPVADYRMVGGEQTGNPSPELLDVLYDSLRKQDWYREHLLELDGDPLDYVGAVDLKQVPEEVAERIRKRFDLIGNWREESHSWNQTLTLLFHQCEEHGLMVLRSGVALGNPHRPLDVEEFRGFALTDPYAPLVFINSRDSAAAQMFTLMHELVHIWLGLSGVSNFEKSFAGSSRVERFCNQVAAEILVPRKELVPLLKTQEPLEKRLARLRSIFKVSSLVLLHRLRELNLLDQASFQEAYEREEQRFADKKAKQSGGGDYYRTQQARVSPNFARAVIGSALEGRTLYRDAYQLLGIKKDATFQKFASRLDVGV